MREGGVLPCPICLPILQYYASRTSLPMPVTEDSTDHFRGCKTCTWLAWRLGFVAAVRPSWWRAWLDLTFGRADKRPVLVDGGARVEARRVAKRKKGAALTVEEEGNIRCLVERENHMLLCKWRAAELVTWLGCLYSLHNSIRHGLAVRKPEDLVAYMWYAIDNNTGRCIKAPARR